MTSGRVRTSRSLLPLRSRGCAANRSPRKSASSELAALDHRAHRAVEDRGCASGAGSASSCCRSVIGRGHCLSARPRRARPCVPMPVACPVRPAPTAISTVNGSPDAPRADAHRDVVESGAGDAGRAAPSSSKPSQRSPSFARTQASLVLAQVEHEHAAAGPAGCGAPRRSARGGLVGVMQRLRQQRDIDRRVRRAAARSSSPRFQVMLRSLRRRGQVARRAPARRPTDRRRSRARAQRAASSVR